MWPKDIIRLLAIDGVMCHYMIQMYSGTGQVAEDHLSALTLASVKRKDTGDGSKSQNLFLSEMAICTVKHAHS